MMSAAKHITFRERLHAGELLVGTLMSQNSPAIAEIMATIGYDWIFVDAEHGAFLPQDAESLIQAAKPCPVIIRLPAAEEVWVKKALDIGAAGIIVPQINTKQDAENIIRWAKYSPEGNRGVGIGRAHGYGYTFEGEIQQANQQTAVILQAETQSAIDNINDIVSVPGVDAILIGPYDLSSSLGVIGDVSNPKVQDAIDTVYKACDSKNLATGIFGVQPEAVIPYKKKGFSLILVGVDTVFLTQSATNALKQVRDSI